jgi:predicted dehydrogenase
MEPVRWGIVGAARIALEKVISGMKKSPLCDIRAIASRSQAKADEAARKAGIPKAYGSYEALLADPEIEAVYIPLPNHLHVPLTLQAARAGKHVLCEKPIALDTTDALQLRALPKGIVFQEAFMVRHHPQWQRARALVREGAIGTVKAIIAAFTFDHLPPGDIRYDPAMGGGGLWDVGCYPVTVARFIYGCEPVRATASVERAGEGGVDVMANGLVYFGRNRTLTFLCGMIAGPTQFVRILGTDGSIEVPLPYYDNLEPADHLIVDSFGKITRESLPADAYQCQGEAFSRAVRGETTLEWGVEDAIGTMKTLDSLAKSAASGVWEAI